MKFIFALFFLLTAIARGADINSALPVSIWDKTGANSINVTSNALNSFLTNSSIPVTQSGTWTTGRTWTLLNSTDSVNAVQSGTWNITNISGTISLPTGASTEATLAKLTQTQGSTTSGQSGPLILGAVTTAAPTYSTAQSSPLSLTTAGALRTDASGSTQPISGTVTANQGTSPWVSNVSQFGGTNVVTGTGVSGSGIPRVTVSSDSSITNISGTISLPTGASTSANQTNGTQKSQVVDGSGNVQPSGDVAARKIFTALTDGTNVTAVKAASTAPLATDPAAVVAISPNNQGQGTITTSLPVVLASNQTGINTFLDKSTSGTITALNATVSIATNGMSSTTFTVTGTWVATLALEGFDGANWISTPGLTQPAGGITAAIVANGTILVNNGGYQQMRIRASAFTSGTATVQINTGAGIGLVEVYNDSGDPLVVKGNGTAGTPDTNVITVQGITSGTPVQVAGPVADGAAATGNPVRIAGKDGSGNVQDILTDTSGNVAILTKDSSGNGINSNANSLNVNTKTNLTVNAPFTVSVGVTTGTFLASNASRKGLVIVNNSANKVSFAFGASAVLNSGITLYPGGTFQMDENTFSTAQINAIASAATSATAGQEFQ